MWPLPDEMWEVAIASPGGPDVLQPRRVLRPSPARGELLVRVQAAGVNRPDVLQRLGKYPLPAGAHPTPGLEIAGEVVALGEGTTGFAVGERVCGLTNGGGYAEYCCLPAGQTLPWPIGFTAVQAAALPETFFTVWANLFQMGRARSGESVLVHGGTSGIGTTALLLSRAFGLRTLATAGSKEKCAFLHGLGVEHAINYRQHDFAEAVAKATSGRGVDLILDIVGAAYLSRNLACLAQDGRLLLIGLLGGSVAEQFDLRQVMARRLVITGSTMRPRTAEEKAAIARELRTRVWPLLDAGQIAPIIHTTFPLFHAAAAHRLMESSQHVGKIVLEVAAEGDGSRGAET